MKVFFDLEFTGLYQNTTLISIGMIDENGQTFYAEFTDYDRDQVDVWIEHNVIAHLFLRDLTDDEEAFEDNTNYPRDVHAKGNRHWMMSSVSAWLCARGDVEMWGDCLAYDWVLFRELFGAGPEMTPPNVLYIPFDICTLFRLRGVDPDISREEYAGWIEGKRQKHNALHDAEMIRACYFRLMDQD